MVATQEALGHFDHPALLDAAVGAHLLETTGDQVGYAHVLIQQYYAALALQQLEIKRRLSKPQLDAQFQRRPKKWDAVVRMLVGLVDDPDSLIRAVAAVDPLLALQCAFSSAAVDEATYTAVITPLIAATSNQRIAAANALVEYDPALAHNLLIEAARSADWGTRLAAAQALRRLDYAPQPDATAAESEAVQANPEPAPQARRCQALGVWLHFLHTPQRQLQQEAAKALGGLRDTAAVPFLVDLMESPDRAISTEAITALGCIGDAAAIPPLVGNAGASRLADQFDRRASAGEDGRRRVPGITAGRGTGGTRGDNGFTRSKSSRKCGIPMLPRWCWRSRTATTLKNALPQSRRCSISTAKRRCRA